MTIDLEFRVETIRVDGGLALDFHLHSPNQVVPIFHKTFRSQILQNPDREQARLHEWLERLGKNQDKDGTPLLADEAEDELASLGRNLYGQLFSPELKREYLEFRSKVKSLLIVSNEPWIPWELVHPYEDSSDCFFGEKFFLTRWLPDAAPPMKRIGIANLACILAEKSLGTRNLPEAAEECQFLTRLAARIPGISDLTPHLNEPTFQQIYDLLRSATLDLVHLAGHGDFTTDGSSESKFLLTGRPFRAHHLRGIKPLHRPSRFPLIFLNACRVARQGWALTGLGGWVNSWIREYECGAFVGPQWTVTDLLARRFSESFYQALVDGNNLGQATFKARHELKADFLGNPGRLAYAVFGHPGCQITLGDEKDIDENHDPSPLSTSRHKKSQATAPERLIISTGKTEKPVKHDRAMPKQNISNLKDTTRGNMDYSRLPVHEPERSKSINPPENPSEEQGPRGSGSIFKKNVKVSQGIIGDNLGTINYVKNETSSQARSNEIDHYTQLGRLHLDRKSYNEAFHAWNRARELSGGSGEIYFNIALAMIAGRRPRSIALSQAKTIERHLLSAINEGGAGEAYLLLALLKKDLYEAKGIRIKSPTIEELLSRAHALPPKRTAIDLLQKHTCVEFFFGDLIHPSTT